MVTVRSTFFDMYEKLDKVCSGEEVKPFHHWLIELSQNSYFLLKLCHFIRKG